LLINKESKQSIINELKNKITLELQAAQAAYDSVKSYATDQEIKAESKYDTRGIEAGYLAGAQKKRVDELNLELNLLEEISLDHHPDSVAVGSVVQLETNDVTKLYFISSTSGGSVLRFQDQVVLVISAFSPIGSQVIGLQTGDVFDVEVSGGTRDYKVIHIF
jgi:transcription elongation GreA/GreB family factor